MSHGRQSQAGPGTKASRTGPARQLRQDYLRGAGREQIESLCPAEGSRDSRRRKGCASQGFREPGVHIGERLEVLVLETAEISAMNEDVAVGNLHRAMGAMRIRNDAERGHGLRSWRGKVLPRPTWVSREAGVREHRSARIPLPPDMSLSRVRKSLSATQ